MRQAWLETRVDVAAQAADPVASLLLDLGSAGLIIDDHEGRACLVAYFDSDSPLATIRVFLRDIGIDGDSIVSCRWIGTEDWAENWKAHFPPVEIGARLFVCPPWAATPPRGRIGIVIHPGMAFGTGHHPTTQGCLALLDRHLSAGVENFLDVGTGSGILAIAAVLLGAKQAVAVDPDHFAREAALDNARRNAVSDRITVAPSIEEAGSQAFAAIAANLQLLTLLELETEISRRAAPGGLLIASGLLRKDAAPFLAAYEGAWSRCDRIDEEEWTSVAMRCRS